jgi:hypothetical protein
MCGVYFNTLGANAAEDREWVRATNDPVYVSKKVEKMYAENYEVLRMFRQGLLKGAAEADLATQAKIDYKRDHELMIILIIPFFSMSFTFLCLWFLMLRMVRMIARIDRAAIAGATDSAHASVNQRVVALEPEPTREPEPEIRVVRLPMKKFYGNWMCPQCKLPNTERDKECFKCGLARKDGWDC